MLQLLLLCLSCIAGMQLHAAAGDRSLYNQIPNTKICLSSLGDGSGKRSDLTRFQALKRITRVFTGQPLMLPGDDHGRYQRRVMRIGEQILWDESCSIIPNDGISIDPSTFDLIIITAYRFHLSPDPFSMRCTRLCSSIKTYNAEDLAAPGNYFIKSDWRGETQLCDPNGTIIESNDNKTDRLIPHPHEDSQPNFGKEMRLKHLIWQHSRGPVVGIESDSETASESDDNGSDVETTSDDDETDSDSDENF